MAQRARACARPLPLAAHACSRCAATLTRHSVCLLRLVRPAGVCVEGARAAALGASAQVSRPRGQRQRHRLGAARGGHAPGACAASSRSGRGSLTPHPSMADARLLPHEPSASSCPLGLYTENARPLTCGSRAPICRRGDRRAPQATRASRCSHTMGRGVGPRRCARPWAHAPTCGTPLPPAAGLIFRRSPIVIIPRSARRRPLSAAQNDVRAFFSRIRWSAHKTGCNAVSWAPYDAQSVGQSGSGLRLVTGGCDNRVKVRQKYAHSNRLVWAAPEFLGWMPMLPGFAHDGTCRAFQLDHTHHTHSRIVAPGMAVRRRW